MIPARFNALRNRGNAMNDKAFAEPVLLSFLKDGLIDNRRSSCEIEAILRVGRGKVTGADGSGGSTWNIQFSAQKAELHIDRNKYPDLTIRTRDKVRALSRLGQPWFEVNAIDSRGMTRLVLQLNEA